MSSTKRIALIGLPTLSAIGIKCLIKGEREIRTALFPSLEEYRNSGESTEGFVVTSDVFVSNLDFFMPRQQKVLVITNSVIPSVLKMNQIISSFDDEIVIEEKVTRLLEAIANEAEEQGELSAREKEVLRLLVDGKINKEIADELCISINTVITHRKNITSKTGIKSVSGLSIYALMNGISGLGERD